MRPDVPVYFGETVELVRRAAAAESLSMSSYVRRAVVERLRRDGFVQPPDEPESPRRKAKAAA
jgi:hypothetical protein